MSKRWNQNHTGDTPPDKYCPWRSAAAYSPAHPLTNHKSAVHIKLHVQALVRRIGPAVPSPNCTPVQSENASIEGSQGGGDALCPSSCERRRTPEKHILYGRVVLDHFVISKEQLIRLRLRLFCFFPLPTFVFALFLLAFRSTHGPTWQKKAKRSKIRKNEEAIRGGFGTSRINTRQRPDCNVYPPPSHLKPPLIHPVKTLSSATAV